MEGGGAGSAEDPCRGAGEGRPVSSRKRAAQSRIGNARKNALNRLPYGARYEKPAGEVMA